MEQAAYASLTKDDRERIAHEPSSIKPRAPSKLELQRQEFRAQKRKVKLKAL